MSDAVRAFVALEIDEAARGRIGDLADELRPRFPGLRWLSRHTLHVTLRFLGDVPPETLDGLAPRLAAMAAACPAATVDVGPLGVFPPRGAPRVLWLGVALTPPLLALQKSCEEAAVACGLPPDPRPFRSHLTLGRWRDRAARPLSLVDVDAGRADLRTLVLFESRLATTGAVHAARARFALGPC